MREFRKVLAWVLMAGSCSTAASAQAVPGQGGDQATVWHLGHSGWAVRLGSALLVFDYQESLQMEGVTENTPRNLDNGLIDPEEISDLDVFVFVTHAHGDHYDPVIFEWQGVIQNLTYIFGWEEQPVSQCQRFTTADAGCHTLGGLRAAVDVDGLQVYTIDSHHNDIPEVAYLVRIGDWVVYHNGDYMADYMDDHAYLKTISDRIDVAFVFGAPTHRWPHLARAAHLAREFEVPVLFPMHFTGTEMCESFLADVAAEGVTAEVLCPTARGQRFVVERGGANTPVRRYR